MQASNFGALSAVLVMESLLISAPLEGVGLQRNIDAVKKNNNCSACFAQA